MKVAVVTGASSGIGLATAEVFAENGWGLVLGARRVERLQEIAPALEKKGAPKVLPLALDVRDQASCQAFASEAQAAFNGAIDVLINNAGLARGVAHVAEGDPADWQEMLDTNVMGLLRLTRLFLPEMIRRDAGHVIHLGSIAGHFSYAGGAVYAGTKHAVKAIQQALRYELCGTKVRVSSIDPGMVETEFSMVRLGDEQKAKSVYAGMTPLTARDIAECVYFAASRPPHVNIDHIIVMPTDQASVYRVHRRES